MQHGDQRDFTALSDERQDENMAEVRISQRQWLKDISIPVYVMVMLFAVASWIDINGLWVELPLLVSELPEGWSLPSYLSIIIQVANIGPIAYTIANRLAPNKVKEWPVVYLIIFIGAAGCLLLAFFWDHTSYFLGKERSTSLIALSSLLALVDTTSSVVFLPYMALYKVHYMTAFYIGEGLSGLIPGIIGLVQGVGSNPTCRNVSIVIHNSTTGLNFTEYKIEASYSPPLFSVEIFFFFLYGMILVSGMAFTCLNFVPFFKREMVILDGKNIGNGSSSVAYEKAVDREALERLNENKNDDAATRLEGTESDSEGRSEKIVNYHRDDIGKDLTKARITFYEMAFLLIASVWINALANGVIAATQSFSSLPYSNTAYTLSVRLSTVANPLACFLALFLPSKSIPGTALLILLGTGGAAYQVCLAAMSPTPPLLGTVMGEFLVISTSVLMTGFFSYAKVSIATILRDEGRKALLWCGASQQLGSFVGAVVAFLLVNVFNMFTSIPPCANMY